MSVWQGDQQLATLEPEKRFYKKPQQPATEVAMRSTLTEDLYLVLGSYDPPSGIATIQAYVNPLVAWLWIGGRLSRQLGELRDKAGRIAEGDLSPPSPVPPECEVGRWLAGLLRRCCQRTERRRCRRSRVAHLPVWLGSRSTRNHLQCSSGEPMKKEISEHRERKMILAAFRPGWGEGARRRRRGSTGSRGSRRSPPCSGGLVLRS
jgi:hypothetical protein